MEKDILSKLEVARLVALQRLDILPESEERRLLAWVERDKKNKALYEQLHKKSINKNAASPSAADSWKLFEKKYRIGKRPRRQFRRILYRLVASAAVLVLAITGTYYYATQPGEEIITSPHPVSAVQLVLENGNKITLDAPQSSMEALHNNAVLHAEKQEINYATAEKETVEIDEIYHTIIVPKYGEYTVRLSDNTTVKLNSESTLTYPVQFKGKERKIRLSGEAYLEVTPDTTRRFIVEAAGTTVTVLGTTFNVNASAPDGNVATTLVNGKVEIGNGMAATIIAPGQQAVTTPGNARIEVKKVDTNVVTAWVRDMFYFDEKPLGEIMQELSHWYEFNVIFEKESLKQRKFTIETSRYENIDKVLKLIEETHVVKCRKEGKTIYIR
ncbi:MAG TPA: DUF4974 domain-containing protein [Butyricimonas virosa]|uniref:DUF4974 domain-containing protein n=1 Tax=Butyricimonas virosa TaxID=544645 RepID=A0A921KZV4_9BACT|nr:DUF4974 domain-containing protein [Butyricimonas virosa]